VDITSAAASPPTLPSCTIAPSVPPARPNSLSGTTSGTTPLKAAPAALLEIWTAT
jgi:hypothetical protein